MGVRTVEIWGNAYSTLGDVSVVANFNGVEVHNGTVLTINAETPSKSTVDIPIISFTIDDQITDTSIASSFAVTGGTLIVSGIGIDQYIKSDPLSTIKLSSTTKHNISMDGVLIDVVEVEDGIHYEVEDSSMIAIDWTMPAIPPGLPGGPAL